MSEDELIKTAKWYHNIEHKNTPMEGTHLDYALEAARIILNDRKTREVEAIRQVKKQIMAQIEFNKYVAKTDKKNKQTQFNIDCRNDENKKLIEVCDNLISEIERSGYIASISRILVGAITKDQFHCVIDYLNNKYKK